MKIRRLKPPHYERLYGPVTDDNAVRAIEFAISRFSEVGATPPAGSRPYRAKAILEDSALTKHIKRPGSLARRLVAESHRSAIEYWTLAKALNPRVKVPKGLHRKLQKVYNAGDDPADDSNLSSGARDILFELWLAAWLTMGGRPVEIAEPDLKVALWFSWYGVAAKRIRSPSKILKRVQEAAGQVRSSVGEGFVAISLDNYSMKRNRRAAGVETGERFFLAHKHIPAAEDWLGTQAPWVKGLLCFGRLANWVKRADHYWLDSSQLQRITLLEQAEPERTKLQQLFEEHSRQVLDAWRKESET